MHSKTTKFLNHLKNRNFEIFTIQTVDGVDVLRHTENSNGMSVQSIILFDASVGTEVTFVIANCPNKLKQEQIIMYLNELNLDRKMKYTLGKTGNIAAQFTYWADDESFNPENLLSMYVAFFRSLLEDGDIQKIMKLIWG